MENIFKTTLKKDVIVDIENNGKREIRFPITKFWATRFTDEYNLDDKTFVFKTFDSLELSSPSNKDTGGETFTFDFDRIFVDNDEFVVTFKDRVEIESFSDNEDILETNDNELVEVENVIVNNLTEEVNETFIDEEVEGSDSEGSDMTSLCEDLNISNEDVLTIFSQWFEDEKILDNFYSDDNVFATNAKQVIILPKGRVLGFKKSLPLNNDVEVRIEFDTNKKIYFESILDFENIENEILNTINEIRKNNFVFVWKSYTGIFMDDNGIYFGIKYSTRKSIGFNRKYNVQ